jgi:membrane protease YdiL (CAAX protease family)
MTSSDSHRGVASRALLPLVLLTFAITWLTMGAYIFLPGPTVALFGEISGSHPLFFLATWAPGIAAVAIVLNRAGAAGLRGFLSRLLLWRCPPAWAAFVLFGLPLVFVAGSLVKGGPVLAPMPPEGAGAMAGLLVFMLFLGPVEELGWRGVAQPLLQRHMAPIWSGLLIGAAWGLWHLPAFFLAGTVFAGWDFAPFFLGNVVLAVLVTPLFNRSRGSLLWPMLFHWQLINPFWPDAQPYDTWILLAVAAAVVWLDRRAMFGRDGAVTEVIPAAAGLRP